MAAAGLHELQQRRQIVTDIFCSTLHRIVHAEFCTLYRARYRSLVFPITSFRRACTIRPSRFEVTSIFRSAMPRVATIGIFGV